MPFAGATGYIIFRAHEHNHAYSSCFRSFDRPFPVEYVYSPNSLFVNAHRSPVTDSPMSQKQGWGHAVSSPELMYEPADARCWTLACTGGDVNKVWLYSIGKVLPKCTCGAVEALKGRTTGVTEP